MHILLAGLFGFVLSSGGIGISSWRFWLLLSIFIAYRQVK